MAYATVEWTRDVDAALERGRQERRAVMLDFSAAPA